MANLSEIRNRADNVEYINVKLVDEESDAEISVVLKKSSLFGSIRPKLAIPWGSKRFIYNGRVLHDRETPLACEMEDDDIINCSFNSERKENKKIIAESRMKSPVEDVKETYSDCGRKSFEEEKKLKEEAEEKQKLYKLLVEERKKNEDLSKENEELFSWKYETLTEKQQEMQSEIEQISEQCDQEKNAQMALYQELKREQLECEKLRRENAKYGKMLQEHKEKIRKQEQEIRTREMVKIEEHEKLKSKNITLDKRVKELERSEINLTEQIKTLRTKSSTNGNATSEGNQSSDGDLEGLRAELNTKTNDIESKDAKMNVLQWELDHMKDAHDRLYKECRELVAEKKKNEADKKKNEKQEASSPNKSVEVVENNREPKIKVELEDTEKEKNIHYEYIEGHHKSIKREGEFLCEDSEVKRKKVIHESNLEDLEQERSEHGLGASSSNGRHIGSPFSILNIEDSPPKSNQSRVQKTLNFS